MENDNIKKALQELKQHYAGEMEKLPDIGKLLKDPVDRELNIDFWSLSGAEIEREMANRLADLDAAADCLPGGSISSRRPWLGKPAVILKKIIRRLTAPYSAMLLQKQNRLNRELVTFQLLAFLKLRQLEKRIKEMEDKMVDFSDPRQPQAEPGKKPARKQ